MNKKIIIAVIIVILVLIGVTLYGQSNSQPKDVNLDSNNNDKINTKLDFPSYANGGSDNSTSVIFYLKDVNDTPIPNETVSITYPTDEKNVTVNVTTGSDGKVDYKLTDIATGGGNVKVSYAGNEKYNGCSDSQNHVSFSFGDG